ncbi:unnamed protein product [Gordionus sp. m RMFG-2023]
MLNEFHLLFYPFLILAILLLVVVSALGFYYLAKYFGYDYELRLVLAKVFHCIKVDPYMDTDQLGFDDIVIKRYNKNGKKNKDGTSNFQNMIQDYEYIGKDQTAFSPHLKPKIKHLRRLSQKLFPKQKVVVKSDQLNSETRRHKFMLDNYRINKDDFQILSDTTSSPIKVEEKLPVIFLPKKIKPLFIEPLLSPQILNTLQDDTKEIIPKVPSPIRKKTVIPSAQKTVETAYKNTNLKPSTSLESGEPSPLALGVCKSSTSQEKYPPDKDYLEYYGYDYDSQIKKPQITQPFVDKNIATPIKRIRDEGDKKVRFMLPGKIQEILPTDEVSEHEYTYVEEYSSNGNENEDQGNETGENKADNEDTSSYTYSYEYEIPSGSAKLSKPSSPQVKSKFNQVLSLLPQFSNTNIDSRGDQSSQYEYYE